MLDWPPLVLILLALTVAQGLAWALSRWLGYQLRRCDLALGLGLPLLLLAPWLVDPAIVLAPTGGLARSGQLALDGPAPEGISPWALQSDVTLQFLPWEAEVRRAVRGGRLPLWSDRIDGGSSPWANPQAEILSPGAWIARMGPLRHHLLLALAVKLLLAIEGAILLARSLGARAAFARLAGVGFGLGGGMIAWAMYPLSGAAAWIPWHALAVVALMRRRGRLLPGVARAALLTAILAVAGHPEVPLGGGLLAATLGMAVMRRDRPLRRLAAAGSAAVLGLLLAAPLLLPLIHAAVLSGRYEDRERQVRGDALFEQGGERLLPIFLNPYGAGKPYAEPFRGRYNWCEGLVPYVGVVALAGWAAALAVGRAVARAAALFGAATVLLASGWRPLDRLLELIPGLEAVTWERAMLAGALATALAGALAGPTLFRRPRGIALLAAVVVVAASLAVRADAAVVLRWLGVAAALCAAALGGRWRRSVGPLLLVVGLADLLSWARPQLPRGPVEWFYPRTELIDLVASRFEGARPFRLVGEGRAVYPSHLAVHGLADVRQHDPLARADRRRVLAAVFDFAPGLGQYFDSFDHVDHPFLDALNVSTVVSHVQAERRLGLVRVGAAGGHTVWFNRGVLARWFVAGQIEAVDDDELESWLRALDDPRRVAVATKLASVAATLAGIPSRVERVRQTPPGHDELEIEPVDRPRLLATSQPWPEGWRASIGGRPAETVVVNGAFLGVVLPPGTDRLSLRFRPPGLAPGIALAAFASLVLGLLRWRERSDR